MTDSYAATSNGWQRQTLPQLIEQAKTDIEANLPGANARLPNSNLQALAAMAAGAADEQLAAIAYFAEQINITTATGVHLERHGAEWGVTRKEATYATGPMAVSVAANTIVPAGSLFQTPSRWRVRTTAEMGSITAAILTIPTQALELGALGNLPTGTLFDTISPIAGVISSIVAAPGLAGGNPREGEEAYKQRILDRIQEPPQGGAAYDYRAWMLEYPGCTRAWVFPKEQGTGTVVCRFVMDETYLNGIPPAAEVERMTQWLDARRPVTAEVFVYAPVPRTIDVVVRDLSPNTPAVREAVDDELRDMLKREGVPGAMLYRSWFWEAVSIAAGSRHHHIDDPPDDFPLLIGQLGILGSLQFVFSPPPP